VVAIAQGLAFASHAAAAATPQAPSAAPSAATTRQLQSTQRPRAEASPASHKARLSNERTRTTWAHPVEEVGIRVHPARSSRTIARTHLETEDGYPEVYLLLTSLTAADGQVWVRLRIPGRPNGRTGWVPRTALADFHVTRWLVEIKLGARRLKAYYKGKLRFSAPVGVGKPSTPTPTGHFWIRERIKLSPGSPWGPYALGTSAYSTLTEWPGGGVVGIHGDFGEPQLIPGAPSHGCVRMHDGDIAWLAPRVSVGTPVQIIS
jgi:lipoprotein-anchoring transpeptidase ErfK/SrfK